MDQQPPDSFQYLRDTICAYQRRLDRESDIVLRDYMAGRLLELENQLGRLTGVAVNRRSLRHVLDAPSTTAISRRADT